MNEDYLITMTGLINTTYMCNLFRIGYRNIAYNGNCDLFKNAHAVIKIILFIPLINLL